MKFDLYNAFFSKTQNRWCPGVQAKSIGVTEFNQLRDDMFIKTLCEEFQKGDKEAKMKLPAICFVGKSKTGKREASAMVPTQLVMLDVDHCDDPHKVYTEKIFPHCVKDDLGICLVHITPSGKGLRVVFEANLEFTTLEDNMKWMWNELGLSDLGKFDEAVKDFSRISFVVPSDYYLYENLDRLFADRKEDYPLRNDFTNDGAPSAASGQKNACPEFTEKEENDFKLLQYRGTLISTIIEKYLEIHGEPGTGEIHNFYNEMVKNFRCILDNNKRKLLYVLPRFGHTKEECWSQIVSICKVNTLSRLPKEFYFFLKDNGFYRTDYKLSKKEEDEIEAEPVQSTDEELPKFPPVFREILKTCPKDFIVPAVNALLPIMGTLTSYLRTVYPFDNREHSTSFFSIIYAPPGTGKGFVERFMDILFEDLKLRDLIATQRENIYLRTMLRKGANDKAPEDPHISLRIIPAKNSEPEFLQKQRDNHGYHMFTYAAEMDSWAKGVKAAGGNKDDMIRIAWDNGEYGQQFKSVNTFKGMVKLYWNVLITGTELQLRNYFKNVENGLVTRCSFSSIENQEFSDAPVWKKLSKRDIETIRKFTRRCDERTYSEPVSISEDLVLSLTDEDFDKELDWRFKFNPFKKVDMSWIMPTIKQFLKEQLEQSAKDIDRARDVFRRRVAVRGFRLALLCYGLWDKPNEENKSIVKNFVRWWMNKDIENIMKLFGREYNEQTDLGDNKISQRYCFDALSDTFTREDVYLICRKQGIRTSVRRIIFDWKKLKVIDQLENNKFVKLKKSKK